MTVPTQTDVRAYEVLAGLLDYPAHGAIRDDNARDDLAGTCPEAAAAFDAFFEEVEPLSPDEREELYVRTFDFSPLCALHVGVHLFAGNGEGPQRSALMAALAGAYREAGFRTDGELPDHLAVILRFRGRLDPDEWEDMARWCLLPATARMLEELERTRSPYRHVLRAIRCLLLSEFPEDTTHA